MRRTHRKTAEQTTLITNKTASVKDLEISEYKDLSPEPFNNEKNGVRWTRLISMYLWEVFKKYQTFVGQKNTLRNSPEKSETLIIVKISAIVRNTSRTQVLEWWDNRSILFHMMSSVDSNRIPFNGIYISHGSKMGE